MPALPTAQIDEVHALVMRKYSALKTMVPISKPQLRALLVIIDSEQDAAETAVFKAFAAGAGKAWLQAKQPIARDLIVEIQRRRAEVL